MVQFITLDNGIRSFLVTIEDGMFSVMARVCEDDAIEYDDEWKGYKDPSLFRHVVMKPQAFLSVTIFDDHTDYRGRRSPSTFDTRNGALFRISPERCVYVSSTVYSFICREHILETYSEIGNNGVPYNVCATATKWIGLDTWLWLPRNTLPPHARAPDVTWLLYGFPMENASGYDGSSIEEWMVARHGKRIVDSKGRERGFKNLTSRKLVTRKLYKRVYGCIDLTPYGRALDARSDASSRVRTMEFRLMAAKRTKKGMKKAEAALAEAKVRSKNAGVAFRAEKTKKARRKREEKKAKEKAT